MNSVVSVSIPIHGMWPTHKELDIRDVIMEELKAKQFGDLQQAGIDRQSMTIAYQVKHEAAALRTLQRVADKHLPRGDYTIHAKPVENSRKISHTQTAFTEHRNRQQPQQLHFDMGM